MTINSDDEQLWAQFCQAENSFVQARMNLIKRAKNLTALIGRALAIPFQRGAALRLLQSRREDEIKEHFDQLVGLASVGHGDIDLTRSTLLRIDHDWLVANIDKIVVDILKHGGEEEFRRFAELYALIDDGLLKSHLARCAIHPDEEVNEIASDFAKEL